MIHNEQFKIVSFLQLNRESGIDFYFAKGRFILTPDFLKTSVNYFGEKIDHFLAAGALVSISFYFKNNGTRKQEGQALMLLEVQCMSCKGLRHGRIKL